MIQDSALAGRPNHAQSAFKARLIEGGVTEREGTFCQALETVPESLRAFDIWIVHREKRPISPHTGQLIDPTKTANGCEFSTAVAALDEDATLSGLGILLCDERIGLGGIDIDDAFDDCGVVRPWVNKLISNFASYTERSPSGKGFHILVKDAHGAVQRTRSDMDGGGHIEVYPAGSPRYLTFTGDKVFDFELCAAPDAWASLCDEMNKPVPVSTAGAAELALVASALKYIPAHDREVWLKVCSGLKHTYGELAFGLFDSWSATSDKYGEVRWTWRSIKEHPNPVTVATIFDLAIQRGWTNSKDEPIKKPVPEPLRRELPPQKAYPVEALGPILCEVVLSTFDVVRAPLSICAQSFLAAAALAVQGHRDVVLDGRVSPLSLYLVTVAESGRSQNSR